MRVVLAAVIVALMTGTAFAQDKAIPKYGEEEKAKTRSEIEAEKSAERAYKRSLQSIPNQGPSDPWGGVRTDAPKTAASPAKPKKTGGVDAKQ